MSAAYDRVIEALAAARCRQQGRAWCCPAHDDRNASLSVNQGDQGAVVKCHAGCRTEEVVAALGLTMADLFDERSHRRRERVATYNYTDETDKLLFQVVRYVPKDFRQRRPDSNGGWIWKLGDTRRVLYRLPKVIEAIGAGTMIYVVEGEKDVHAIEKAGGIATCNPMGAGTWRPEYAEALVGAEVVVVADDDKKGHRHAAQVVASLQGKARSAQLVKPAHGNDADDHLRAGRGLDEFEPVMGPTPHDTTDLTVEAILEAAGVDPEDAERAESVKDLLKLMRGGQRIADRLVQLVREAGVELFHAENRVPYAMYEVDDHVETHRIGSKDFTLYLRRLYHRAEESVLPTQALRAAEQTLESFALFEGEIIPVHLRIAGDPGAIYIDLGDQDWRCIRITASGWQVLERHPVRFRRTAGMLALPIPQPGGSLDELLDLLNLEDDAEADRRLLVAWLLDAARPGTPFAVLELTGEEGTAKSTVSRALRAMLDPSTTPLRRCPTKSDDLFVSANASWIVAFDNVSGVQQWVSDDLCRLATGGGQSKRELYTDDSEHLIDVRRPVIVNGIEEIATKGDLLRRTLRVELPLVDDSDRLTESEFWSAFDAVHPRLLGALCDAVSCALRRVGEIEIERKPSMADLAQWVTAAEPALGWPDGAFMEAYENRRHEAHEVVIESELAGAYIRQKCEDGFEGTATELLSALDELVDGNTRKRSEWPKSPRKLTGIVKRIAPALRKLGYTVSRGEWTRRGTLWVLGRRSRA